jgi:hypothetical protein
MQVGILPASRTFCPERIVKRSFPLWKLYLPGLRASPMDNSEVLQILNKIISKKII